MTGDPGRAALRVALLTETYRPLIGGGETQAALLAEELVRRGHDVLVLTRRTARDLPARERMGGARVVRLGPIGRHHLLKWGLAGTVPVLGGRLLRDADVVLVSGFRVLGAPARLVSLVHGIPVVLKADNNGELSGAFFARGLARLGLRPDSAPVAASVRARNRLLRGADGWVAMSADIAREYRDHGVAPARIHRIPNGYDPARFHPATPDERRALRARLELPAAARVAVYTGRLVSYKGLPTLLRAWRPVVAGRPDATLLLVGPGGLDIHNCESELREYVNSHGLARNVRFAGAVSDVETYLRAADAFVLPSENEAFGLSLVEAMACGLPCVATPVGAMKEIVADGRTGLLVPPRDEARLADALGVVLDGGAHVASMGAAAAAVARERYGIDAVADAYETLFRDLAAA